MSDSETGGVAGGGGPNNDDNNSGGPNSGGYDSSQPMSEQQQADYDRSIAGLAPGTPNSGIGQAVGALAGGALGLGLGMAGPGASLGGKAGNALENAISGPSYGGTRTGEGSGMFDMSQGGTVQGNSGMVGSDGAGGTGAGGGSYSAGGSGSNGMYATAAGNAAPLGDGSSGAAGPTGSLTSLAQADANAGQNAYNLQAAQYQWGQNQFNSIYPYAQQYMQSQLNATNQAQGFAQGQQNFYNQNYQPLQKQFIDEAANYNSPARAAQAAGAAETDVANSFGAQRSQALANLESYGIDPSQTRYGALDASSRIAQAAATAAAGTQSRLQTEATGLGLQGQAINVGQGYAGNIATTLNSGTNAGNAGISALNATTAMGANTMGTPTQWSGLSTAANTAGANAQNQQNSFTTAQGQLALGNNQLGFQKDANNSAGIGQIVGGALGLAGTVAANSGGVSNLLSNIGNYF